MSMKWRVLLRSTALLPSLFNGLLKLLESRRHTHSTPKFMNLELKPVTRNFTFVLTQTWNWAHASANLKRSATQNQLYILHVKACSLILASPMISKSSRCLAKEVMALFITAETALIGWSMRSRRDVRRWDLPDIWNKLSLKSTHWQPSASQKIIPT